MRELEKIYDPSSVEGRIYENWVNKKYFHAEVDSKKDPYTIVIPPPNVTGQLHMGHALDETLQDILIRYKRMQGYNALWVPGTDHAGIATQIKVEAELRKEGLTRYDLGREKFLERVWDWKRMYGSRIINQLKKLGCSCDWDRERFTMDEGCSRAVREVFVNLYEKGLIYRGYRIINWCPSCKTALSDAEVEYAEQPSHLWHIKYPAADGNGYIIVATTRPETMLGDTAVAVNPDDERYTGLVGKNLILPLMNKEIPVVADEYVEKEFGTGAVKITPAHDPNDFEVGKRHNLECIRVIGDDGSINANGGAYEGMERIAARNKIVEDLDKLGLLVKIEDYNHNVGQCYRCGSTVEPVTSDQWFVKMKPLAEEALRVVKDGEVKFVPDRFSKTYINWMENVHDWCISRQLWWGHRIPAFYCDKCGKMYVSKEDMTTCECGAPLRQEEDVLDTWFSSALWPFSTLGYPDKTPELDYFYPTSTLVTGYDIIFFWVARMIFSAMEHMKEIPFRHVFIHGLVRDELGRKMSKSLGNGIDPLEIVNEFGADALRFTLATGNSPGNDMRFSRARVEASRNFANKIWNASRFVLMNLSIDKCELPHNPKREDKWIISRMNNVCREVTDNLDKFELGIALGKLYDFMWDELCDWYIELVKPRLYGEDGESKSDAQRTLVYVLSNTLKMLHPFMPFITEEVYTALPTEYESIMISPFPKYDAALDFPEDEREMSLICGAIKAIRNIRTEMNVPPARRSGVYAVGDMAETFAAAHVFFEKLAGASHVEAIDEDAVPDGAVSVVVEGAKLYMPMEELVDIAKERERLTKEKENLEREIARSEAKLSNENFVSKAPEKVIADERAKGEKYREMYRQTLELLEKLG